jgi:hypothetical protein
MSKITARLLVLGAVLVLTGCFREPFPPPYYTAPAPPPLQPYLGPPLAVAAPATARIVKHRRVKKRYHRTRCRCTPVR